MSYRKEEELPLFRKLMPYGRRLNKKNRWIRLRKLFNLQFPVVLPQGNAYHSKKQRSFEHADFLRTHGNMLASIELDGTLFFGATDTLLDTIDHTCKNGARYIILDFKRVNSIDTTGYKVLEQTHKRLSGAGVVMLCGYLDPLSPFWHELEELGVCAALGRQSFYSDTDSAREACEDMLLAEYRLVCSDDERIHMRTFIMRFLGFTRKDVTVLMPYTETIEYQRGERIFSEGDKGNAMFLILQGMADAGTKRKKRIATLAPGTVFGEMALLDKEPRSANIFAKQKLVCIRISVNNYERIKQQHPDIAIKIHRAIGTVLVRRLRDANRLISELDF